MATTVIITVCSLLLLAYAFDVSSRFTKIPSVILLLLLGWIVRQGVLFFQIEIPDLTDTLQIIGTIGLILIVLEGALELEFNKSKFGVIRKSIVVAVLPLFATAFLIAWAFAEFGNVSYTSALVNAIPFCVISSSIAIPSVRNMSPSGREFIVYESSFSDIIGVLFFNFMALNAAVSARSFGHLIIQILIITLVSFVSVLGLSYLLSRLRHHITYTPIILFVVLIYAISKYFHLPGLIFILVFGLFLGNLDELAHYKWIHKLRPEKLNREIKKFKSITLEATFLIRSLFFLVFGFTMKANEILDLGTLPWSAGIVGGILLIRWITLKSSGVSIFPALFVAPRGLITILLFLAIVPEQSIPVVNNSLIIQTIIISVLVMMIGLMSSAESKKVVSHPEQALN